MRPRRTGAFKENRNSVSNSSQQQQNTDRKSVSKTVTSTTVSYDVSAGVVTSNTDSSNSLATDSKHSNHNVSSSSSSSSSSSTQTRVCRQTDPPNDLQFSWHSHSVVNSPDQGWTNLHTPQSRAPLSSALPSQMLFAAQQPLNVSQSAPSTTTRDLPPGSSGIGAPSQQQHQRLTSSFSPSQMMSRNDDYVTLAFPSSGDASKSSDVTSPTDDDHAATSAVTQAAKTTVRMGVSSVQRRVQEHEKHKTEVSTLSTISFDLALFHSVLIK